MVLDNQRAHLESTFIECEGLMQADFKNRELIEFLRNCDYSDQEIAKILSRVRDYDAKTSRRAIEEEEWAKAKRH
ncbi:MAG: hypothetical protein ACI9G1_003906 [Pirellulaceae bacterium]|jgi:hypothetical protein